MLRRDIEIDDGVAVEIDVFALRRVGIGAQLEAPARLAGVVQGLQSDLVETVLRAAGVDERGSVKEADQHASLSGFL